MLKYDFFQHFANYHQFHCLYFRSNLCSRKMYINNYAGRRPLTEQQQAWYCAKVRMLLAWKSGPANCQWTVTVRTFAFFEVNFNHFVKGLGRFAVSFMFLWYQDRIFEKITTMKYILTSRHQSHMLKNIFTHSVTSF